jgi:hypothetical protein
MKYTKGDVLQVTYEDGGTDLRIFHEYANERTLLVKPFEHETYWSHYWSIDNVKLATDEQIIEKLSERVKEIVIEEKLEEYKKYI